MSESHEVFEEVGYVSPIANPRLSGKVLSRSLKLVKRVISLEKLAKQHKLSAKGQGDPVLTRLVKRGVQDVTKALRKGVTGIVLIASDVYPIDVIAHVPILCEELSITYGYVTSKRILSDVCHSKRPTCVVMIAKPAKDLINRINKIVLESSDKLNYTELFNKVESAIKKGHPFM